jgi:predicted GH43/DUF377 family glycosyl hydrolase
MLTRSQDNPILKLNKNNKWEAGAVFNPGIVFDNGVFHMVYRAVASGFYSFTTVNNHLGYKNFISSIGYAKSKDGIHFQRYQKPLLKPDQKWDYCGCEDPRITKFEDKFYIFYTAMNFPAYTPNISRIGLATTKDFKKVQKHGVVGPDNNAKAAALFPERINGKIAIIFTWQPETPHSSIAIAYFDNIKQLLHAPKSYWPKFISSIDKHIVLPPPKKVIRGHEVGAPPLKTSHGWLLIYCGADRGLAKKGTWSISAALLDLKNPKKVIAKSKKPILAPKKSYEIKGLVPNVTFPGGAVIVKDKLFVYYGAADKSIAMANVNLNSLLKELMKHKVRK